MSSDPQTILLGLVTIKYTMTPDEGTRVTVDVEGVTDEATQLGLLEIAKDIILHHEMEGADDG